jgi:phage shock protein A
MAHADAREALRQAIALEHALFTRAAHHDALADRWRGRAELAVRRGEEALAREALARGAAEERRAAEYRAQYLQQADRVRRAKGRATPGTPTEPIEHRLDQLALEDRLERDLAALKARLASAAVGS